MQRRHALSLLASSIAASLALSLPAVAAPTESQRFHRWLDAEWALKLKQDPLLATSLGDPRYNARFVDTTTAAWRAQAKKDTRRQLRQLAGFRKDRLEPSDQVSYSILKLELEQELAGERFPDWMQPISQIGGLPSFLAQMGSGESIQPFRTTRDYDDWLQRLAAAVRSFDGSIANMRAGLKAGVTQPRAVMDKVVPQLQALAVSDPEQSLFWGPVKNFPDAVPAADRSRITAALRRLLAGRVLPAYARLLAFVRDEYTPRARTSTAWSDLPDGPAWYAHQVRQNTTLALTPDEIHALGLKEVARILGEMEGVRQQVGFQGDLKAFFKHLQDDPQFYFTRPEDLLNGYRELQKKINGLTPKLFDIAPKADYQVKEVEAFRAESDAGASYQHPSSDGSRPGVFYVNTFNLKAQPIFGMETLSLHEASPGHHFQISIAQEDTSLPAFRRFGSHYTAYVEGWALYAESLGKELGLFTDPYQWYGRLSDEQLRAMRLVVDTGLHAKGWTREQAIRYMLDNSSMAESDVVSEVERYIVWPGQALGYKIGQIEISRLRAEAEQALGAKFDIKGFHRVVLTAGQVPLPVLRELVQAWVAKRQAG
ncbi:MAG: DUF885 domain-containing protein [Proteobacteria bacterium]|jgi:uncharacterized protein (DUF885 family)|nr:DUF885 domain-containing protein [Methylibium sp.]MCH8856586.1 DUF885 domain-containing protein [Pseudomonadota bacterium]|mmetsp:Transcript_44827/g.105547  ORF Transcript_44827/g.105547 Transcript_44827/m.105547 type:complete len:597 (+) Transcript_44827:239-2029(+)